jgi:hypothetical protein
VLFKKYDSTKSVETRSRGFDFRKKHQSWESAAHLSDQSLHWLLLDWDKWEHKEE